MSKMGQFVSEMKEQEQEIQEAYHEYLLRKTREERLIPSNNKWDQRFMEQAKLISTWSKDPSTQIGVVIVNDEKRILATGYNGFPRGIADDKERLNNREEKLDRIIHGEMNALMNALYNGVSVKDATMYVYGLPICCSCAKSVIQSGIKRVVVNKTDREYWADQWDNKSAPMFEEAGVQITIM